MVPPAGTPAPQPSPQSAPAVRVRLLGGFGVTIGGVPVPEAAWRLQKAKGLVKLLALAPGHRLARDQLLDLLWPDFAPEAAANNLYRTLAAARAALGPAVPLRLRGGVLALDPAGPLAVDVAAFEAAAARARRRAPAARAARAPRASRSTPARW
jgi:DNA-binding SARP family transcriptional activator